MRNLIIIFLISFIMIMGCAPFEHKNPYDPETELQEPGELNASIKYIKFIGDTYVRLKWDRSINPNFYFYGVALSKEPIGAEGFEMTEEMVDELMAVDYYKDFDIEKAAPKFTAASKIIYITGDQNEIEFETEENLMPNTTYYFYIYVFCKNFWTFSVSEEVSFQTIPDMSDKNVLWADVYSEMAESFQILYDVEVDANNLYVSGFGYRVHQAFDLTNNEQFGYFIRKISLANISAIGYDPTTILISGDVVNSDSTIYKVYGFAVDPITGLLYVPDLLDGDLFEITNVGFTNSTKGNSITMEAEIVYMGIGEDNALYEAGDGVILKRNKTDLSTNTLFWDGDSDGYNKFHGIDADINGNVYVVDWEGAKIAKLTGPGIIEWNVGGNGSAFGKFNNPNDLVIHYENGKGYIYVADTGNGRVQKFDLNGNFVSSIDMAEFFGNLMTEPRGLAIGEGITASDGEFTISGDILFIASKTMIVAIKLP